MTPAWEGLGAPWEETWQVLVEEDCRFVLWGPRPSPPRGLVPWAPTGHRVPSQGKAQEREAACGHLAGVRWRMD